MNPYVPAVHFYLAQTFARTGDGERAIRHFELFREAGTDPAAGEAMEQQDPWLTAGGEVKPLGTSQHEQKTYEYYACADPSAAKEFLRAKDVDRPLYYVEIDTPDGIWAKDIDSLYQPRLPHWKTDLTLTECDGSATGLPDWRGFEYCVKGMSDNFVIDVGCGRCEHVWLDALRHQAFTVVRCPSCGAYNKIGTHHIRSVVVTGP